LDSIHVSTTHYPLACQRAFHACTLGAADEYTPIASSRFTDTAPGRMPASAHVTPQQNLTKVLPKTGTRESNWRIEGRPYRCTLASSHAGLNLKPTLPPLAIDLREAAKANRNRFRLKWALQAVFRGTELRSFDIERDAKHRTGLVSVDIAK